MMSEAMDIQNITGKPPSLFPDLEYVKVLFLDEEMKLYILFPGEYIFLLKKSIPPPTQFIFSVNSYNIF